MITYIKEDTRMKNLEKNNQIQIIMGLYTLAAFAMFVVFAATRDGFAAAFAGWTNAMGRTIAKARSKTSTFFIIFLLSE